MKTCGNCDYGANGICWNENSEKSHVTAEDSCPLWSNYNLEMWGEKLN